MAHALNGRLPARSPGTAPGGGFNRSMQHTMIAEAEGVLQMNRRPRTYYTGTQRALMWERWKAGWTLHQIGHLFDRPHTSIHNVLSRTGGIRPPERRRSEAALSLSEREEISRALVAGETLRSIAARLGRAPSTVSRELKRNGGQYCRRASTYQAIHSPSSTRSRSN